jgi:hypothetical protein
MRRLHADRGDNPDPGIGIPCSKKIVDERCAIRQRTQFTPAPFEFIDENGGRLHEGLGIPAESLIKGKAKTAA